ncbi:hypothetical protein FQN53_002847 [Emmonsiellopsis sp. PD_33]|nr:hypothetical protein FQN53_002847 [Emmonsiellopsis sp. PD_33]
MDSTTPSKENDSEFSTTRDQNVPDSSADANSANSRLEKASNADLPDERNKYRSLHGIRWVIAIVTVFSLIFLFGLDTTAVADVTPTMISRFGQAEKLPWLGSGFALGAMNILPWGKSFGVFNIKWTYILSLVIFEVGSAICGAAPTMDALIVGRVIAGMGGAGMYLGTITYIAMTTSPREGPHYMAIAALVWGVGTVLGPIIGGAFAESAATWRWVFYINLVIGAVFSPVYFFLLPNIDLQPTATLLEKHKQVDWLSIIFLDCMMMCFVMAINFGGTVFAWDSPSEIVLWVMSAVIFLMLCASQYFHPFVKKEHVLFPIHLLKNSRIAILSAEIFLGMGVLQGGIYYFPLYFQFAKGDSPIQAATRIFPYVFLLVTGGMINAALMVRFGYYMPWYLGGGILVTVGSALMCTVKESTPVSAIYGYTILIGFGAGSFSQACYPVSQQLVQPGELTNVIGLISISQFLGIILFLAIMGTTYQNLVIQKVQKILPNASEAQIREFIGGASTKLSDPLSKVDYAAIIDAIIDSMRAVWIILLVAGAICTILAVFLGREKLFKKEGTVAMAG